MTSLPPFLFLARLLMMTACRDVIKSAIFHLEIGSWELVSVKDFLLLFWVLWLKIFCHFELHHPLWSFCVNLFIFFPLRVCHFLSKDPIDSILKNCVSMYLSIEIHRQLRARRALLQIKDVPLRTRRALLPLILYSNSALLVLNGTSLSCNNALLALNWWHVCTH